MSFVTKSDLARLEHLIRADSAETRSLMKEQIADAKTDMVRWTLLTLMSFASLAATAVYFVLQNVR